jgi:cell division protein FtsW (lipid II flippase)
MRRNMPELLAIPLVLVGIGIFAVLFFAANAGLWAWLVLGLVLVASIVLVALGLARRPRAAFEGAAAPAGDDVHRVLLVVDDACSASALEALGGDGTAFFVVAPAVSSRVARWTGDEQAYGRAEEHLAETLAALGELGFEATGRVGSHDPLQAADDGLREFAADEVVFALHDADGVVDAARSRYAVPVRELAR